MTQTDSITGGHKARRLLGGAILPLAISAGLCWLLFRGMDFKAMWETMKTECDFRWMWANIALTIAAHVARAARWQLQLKALGIRSGLWELTLSIFGTYSVNLVLPRLGELWRTGFVAQRQNAPFTKVFGSMVADRLTDTLAVLLLTLATFTFAASQLMSFIRPEELDTSDPAEPSFFLALLTSPWLWAGILLAAGACVWLWARHPGHRMVRAVRGILAGLWQGFAVIVRMDGKGKWLFYTVFIWGAYIASLWMAFQAFPLTAEVTGTYGFKALMVCFILTSISMGVPSNGGIGPYQWALIFGLSLYNVPGLTRGYSAAFANMVMGTSTITLIILGLFTFGWIARTKNKK
ncbi:MAG: flippase-like domain-containing protein [Duncaniella sp.]|nr:flippase-like domain-containing protein [Duncaniella sp.]